MTQKTWSVALIRKAFLDYFQQNGHMIVPSASLVPAGDKTLLFTNAGMVPFKDTFLGLEQRPYVRAVSAQRCVRAGGKHNDLDNVGYTARHHTFFEMLGNFSFGDYFKEEAIHFGWHFLTEILKLPKEKLWITVFEDDEEAEAIWKNKIGIDPNKFSRCGAKDNFWSMGNTGPCGPCSEIFYDHGPEVAGGPPGSPEDDGDRYVEIWNLVFMQFNRSEEGTMTPLPKPSVDTGMGLERIAAVLQSVHSNYETDIFSNILTAAWQLAPNADANNPSFKVIADHIRSCSFMICDGILPSNEGRGYVLRRIIRRAIRHGHSLGIQQTFFYKMLNPLIEAMSDAYPELKTHEALIKQSLQLEENRFRETLETGLKILNQSIRNLSGDVVPGEIVFRLYDTYGFPFDLTEDFAREQSLKLDKLGFEALMEQQRQQARKQSKFTNQINLGNHALQSIFVGYTNNQAETTIIAMYKESKPVETLHAGDSGWIILSQTPFYAESGGQVGDTGVLSTEGATFKVTDTQKAANTHLCIGKLTKGTLSVNQSINASIDTQRRIQNQRHHSGTHLLHEALRKILGNHVVQKGSLVSNDRLRFDFSHPTPISETELSAIEQLTNQSILENAPVNTSLMPIEQAKQQGAMALFDEKYGDEVRVVTMGNSVELCGGTHVHSTGAIGMLKITLETGVSSGVRRIEAVCGEAAHQWLNQRLSIINALSKRLKSQPEKLIERLEAQSDQLKKQEQKLAQLSAKINIDTGRNLASELQKNGPFPLLIKQLDQQSPTELRTMIDQLKSKLQSAIIVLASTQGDKVNLACGITPDLTDQIKAGALVNLIAKPLNGKGGGRPDMAMAGASNPEQLPAALQHIPEHIKTLTAS